ncbi:nuclear transport factor 2 family protein [Actinomadura sp. SCN-SB]|uniref:nuclear transport factor 2 family protein n=1 Tax=Actinomadura sp. SCN-SB TaxID=3373092 RepID=UPI003752BEBE
MRGSATLTDRDAIVDLAVRLGAWLDERGFDTDDGRALYAEDVLVHSPSGVYRGLEEVLEHLRETSPRDQRTFHAHSDFAVAVDGDGATLAANQVVYFYRPGGELFQTSGLRVDYTLTRTPDGWRLATMRISLRWQRTHD